MATFTINETDWVHDAPRLSAVRRTVFIDEQGVPEALEWDAHDATALHLLATTVEGVPIGCARLLPDGHIGRMAVLSDWRRQGVGQAMLAVLVRAARKLGMTTLELSAQTHAAAFYVRAGFVTIGEEYDEAGIPHVAMQIKLA